ncbi:MAG: hypothetical protein ACI4UK_06555 [Floccifex sp.]
MEKKDVLDFYWKYFDLHSRQRMQMMGFYITIEVALIGGFFVDSQLFFEHLPCAYRFA